MAMTQKTFASRLAVRAEQRFGLSFDDILKLIEELLPIIFSLPCFMAAKTPKKLQANIDEEYRRVSKKKNGRCLPRLRRALAKRNVTDRDEQDTWYEIILQEAFADSQNVAVGLMKAYANGE